MTLQHDPNGVLAVLVVYERDLEHVEPWMPLRLLLTSSTGKGLHLRHVLVYDNSVRARAEPPPLRNCTYVHNPQNGGTAAAYAYAAELAQDLGLGWLLLLDHDTRIPEGFLGCASVALAANNDRPAALLPWVFHGALAVSPARVTWTGSIRPIARKSGVSPLDHLTGIASASLVDSASLQAIGALPPGLWLDYVDHWIFMRFHALGKQLVVFDAMVEHDLSILDPATISRIRLHSILDGEAAILAMLGTKAWLVYPLRLAVRMLRYGRKRPALAMHILAWIAHRIRGRM